MTAGSRRSRRLAVLAALLAAVAVACGVPVNDEVELLAQDEHTELLVGTSSTTAPVADPEEGTVVELFFVQDNKLEVVERPFISGSSFNDVLDALESGPLPDEVDLFAEGPEPLQTFVPGGLSARFGTLDRETGAQHVDVDPAAELRQRVEEQTEGARLIVSQIVCTAMHLELDNVAGIEIFDGDEKIPLSDNAAQPIAGPAQIKDFDNCTTGTEQRQEQAEAEAGETDEDGEADEGGSTTTTEG